MNKGFTLIELLGVLAVLAILAVITVPIIQGLMEDSLEESKNIQEEAFEKAAESWAGRNAFSLPTANGGNISISLQTLVNDGFLETNSDGTITIGNSDEKYNLAKNCVRIENTGTATKTKYKYTFMENCSNPL